MRLACRRRDDMNDIIPTNLSVFLSKMAFHVTIITCLSVLHSSLDLSPASGLYKQLLNLVPGRATAYMFKGSDRTDFWIAKKDDCARR